MQKLSLAFLLGAWIALSGCQTSVPVQVEKEDLIKPKSSANLKFTMLAKAKDVRSQGVDQVGRHTISLLMIPGPTVTTETEHLDEAIANRVRETLTSYGYTISTVDKIDQGKGPVLVIQIDDLRNYLFSWVYPLGFVWGKMELSLHLMSPDGTELWKANLEGSGGIGASIFYMAGFEGRVKSDMTANVNQIVEVVSSKEFADQLQKAQAGSR